MGEKEQCRPLIVTIIVFSFSIPIIFSSLVICSHVSVLMKANHFQQRTRILVQKSEHEQTGLCKKYNAGWTLNNTWENKSRAPSTVGRHREEISSRYIDSDWTLAEKSRQNVAMHQVQARQPKDKTTQFLRMNILEYDTVKLQPMLWRSSSWQTSNSRQYGRGDQSFQQVYVGVLINAMQNH